MDNVLQDIWSELVLSRAIHILVEKYNRSIQPILFGFLVVTGVTQIICVVALIWQTSWNSVPVALNMFYLTVNLDTVLIILIIFGFAGDLYASLNSMLSDLKRQNQPKIQNKMERKEYRMRKCFFNSCQPHKIKFGLSNFIEKTIPILQNFCVERIIDLLLVTK